MKQLSFATLSYQNKKITTKREKFLNEMEQVVPWKRLLKSIEPHSTKKNNQYYFGIKIHIGTDINSNVIHTATVTAANTADITEMPNLATR